MKILVLGGTGAMGVPLVNYLSAESENEIHITSRKARKSKGSNIIYIQGNAKELSFIATLVKECHYDVIVDFMSHDVELFPQIADLLMENCTQYVFISTARVYAATDNAITEESPRLLDVCNDSAYLATNEYAIRKAREEDYLKTHGSNWTIIRPSITYNSERLQLVIGEKEDWLFRALNGRAVVFPKELSDVKTTMTYGNDVSRAIAKLVMNPRAFGVVVHIAGAKSCTWGEVLDIYKKAILNVTGKEIKVVYSDDYIEMSKALDCYYQVKYARAINREFNNEKLVSLIGNTEFMCLEDGLNECVKLFVDNGAPFGYISWKHQAYFDRFTKEATPIDAFPKMKNKLAYLVSRYVKRL